MSKEVAANEADAGHVTDGELVALAVRGKSDGFEELVRRYQKQATSVAWRLLNNRDDAMEVVQDAFLRAFEKIQSLADPDRFGSWMLRITSNLALNRRRSRALRRTASLDGKSDDDSRDPVRPDPRAVQPVDVAEGKDLEELLKKALDELPDMQRMALVMFSLEKMPQKQVADILQCSVEAVKWHVFTARKKLREKLGDFL